MPISVKCDSCGRAMRVRDQLAGKKIKCGDCGAHVDVPGRARPVDDDEGGGYQIKAEKPRRRAREDEDEWDDDFRPARRKKGANTGLVLGGAALIGLVVLCGLGGLIVYLTSRSSAPANPPLVANEPQVNAPQNPGPGQPAPAFGPNQNQANNGFNPPRFRPGQPNQADPGNNAPGGFRPVGPANKNLPERVGLWRGKPDPQVPAVTISLNEPVNVSVKLGSAALFPRSPSVFVALGTNGTERDERQVWNIETGKKQPGSTIKGYRIDSDFCALSADGRYFAGRSMADRRQLLLIDLKSNTSTAAPIGIFPKMLAFGGSNRLVLIDDKAARAWPMPAGAREVTIPLENLWDGHSVAVSHGGNYLAYYNRDFKSPGMEVYDLETGQSVGTLPAPEVEHGHPQCEAVAFSPDGTELAGLFKHWQAAIIAIWDMEKGELKATFQMDQFDDQLTAAHRVYKGPRLTWFPDNKRWLAYGELVVDRQTEQPTFKVPDVGGFGSQHLAQVLPNGHLVIVTAPTGNKPMTLASLELTEEKLKQASDIVASGGTAADTGLPKLTQASRNGARALLLDGPAGTWKVSADPTPEPKTKLMPATLTLHDRPLKLLNACLTGADVGRLVVQYGRKSDFFGIDAPVASRPARGNAGKAAGKDALALPDSPAFLDTYDLVTGKVVSTTPITFDCQLMAVSADGKLACVRIQDKKDRLDVFEIESGNHVAGFRPYQDAERENEREIEAAAFVDNTHLMTMNNWEHTVTLWEVPSCKAVWTINDANTPGLSPGRKYVTVASRTGREYRFFEALSGEPCGAVEMPGTVQAAAFHPDGQLLGAVVSDGAMASFVSWKLVDGTVDKEFPIPQIARVMQWCGRTNVLLDNRQLIDLPGKVVVWNYTLLGQGIHMQNPPDVRHWYMMQRFDPRNRAITLNAVSLPDSAAQQTILSSDPKPDYVLEPGSSVSLSVNLGVSPPGKANFATEVATAFSAMLQKNGCSVSAGAPVSVQITSGNGEVRQGEVVQLREFGNIGTETIPVERVKYTVAITRNGQKAWETSGTASNAGFGIVQKKPNVTWQDQLRGDMWNSFENQLRNFKLPSYVIANGNGYGTSQLTADGIRARP